MRVAIQGEIGSFHDQAAQDWFGGDISIVPAESFSEVFGLLNRHEADAAVVAIENSLHGSINQVYDLIESHGYPIVGEHHLRIHQQLIGHLNQKITHVYSHPVALAQCEQFLATNYPDAKKVEHHDTAAAVEFIKRPGMEHAAAIASEQAASLHEMPIITKNIEDNSANFTRFLIIQPGGHIQIGANRTSIVITTNHEPGALVKILQVFASNSVNLSKLQSRPIVGKPWKYSFYLVLDTAGQPLYDCMKQIKPFVISQKILGEYVHDNQELIALETTV